MSKENLDLALAANAHKNLVNMEFSVGSLLGEMRKAKQVDTQHFKRLLAVQEALDDFKNNLDPTLFFKC